MAMLKSSPRRYRVLVLSAALAAGLAGAGCEPEPVRAPVGGPSRPVIEYLSHQEILTPLPLRVRLPAQTRAEHVFVLFRTWGSGDWGTLELARAGQTWTGQISCREVSTVTGDTKYFFLALDRRGEVVAGSGSPDWPHVATIVGKIPGGPRSLPGQEAPERCHDPADCPPDFPGCPAYTVLRPVCVTSADCGGGQCAWDGYCDSPPAASGVFTAEVPASEPDPDDDELLAAAVRRLKGRYRTAGAR
ncbi:MAG: hypothetical protein R3B70_49055 [Polyangiaceae bacterium]